MTTELKRFTEAYATMTVATYEPLILNWISYLGIRFVANLIAYRAPKAAFYRFDGTIPAANVLGLPPRGQLQLPDNIPFEFDDDRVKAPVDIHGQPIDPTIVQPINVPGYPNAVAVGNRVLLNGFTEIDPGLWENEQRVSTPVEGGFFGRIFRRASPVSNRSATASKERFIQGVKTIPITVSGTLGVVPSGFHFTKTRDKIQANLVNAVKDWVTAPDVKDLQQLMRAGAGNDLQQLMRSGVQIDKFQLPVLWPDSGSLHEALSPIGIAHFYRQLYFNKEEGVGPIEEAFTIAPLETLEVVYQTVRKQIHEEILEQGLEVVSDMAVEEKNLDEVSDKVSSLIQQDVSASMTTQASGGTGVWQVGATATGSFGISSQNSREFSTRRLKEVTKKASERITKSFSIKTRDVTEVTTTNMTRRVIRNDSDQPVSYGLRRVLRRVNVKVQDLGPRLVWQLYVRDPGRGLARSRFVHFREAEDVAPPGNLPGVPPRPGGGVETDSVTTTIEHVDVTAGEDVFAITIVVKPGADRDVTSVSVESISDLEAAGKNDTEPAPHANYDLGSSWSTTERTYTAKIRVRVGDGLKVRVNYSYTWMPSQAVLDAWETLRRDALQKFEEEQQIRKFEQNKQLITERSKIKSRPANDLRREERYEIMNRMVSHLFGRGDDASEPTPLEIEYFHRYFDIDGIFTYTHPSWWRPRRGGGTRALGRKAYEITAESEPAPLGSSLGWLIQLDGDRRRNELLNSPWARVCVPMRPGRERQAVAWLAAHIEGGLGFRINSGPLGALLSDIEGYRRREGDLGLEGADYVTVSSKPDATQDALTPEGVYPVIDEFDVTVPTDGFVYDKLNVVIP